MLLDPLSLIGIGLWLYGYWLTAKADLVRPADPVMHLPMWVWLLFGMPRAKGARSGLILQGSAFYQILGMVFFLYVVVEPSISVNPYLGRVVCLVVGPIISFILTKCLGRLFPPS